MARRLLSLSLLAMALFPASAPQAADLTIDRTTKFQTIEGFGFFGGADVWWASAGSVLDAAWSAKVIDDLGMTMWRNEYYPTATSAAPQDADWAKQRPVVEALYAAAARSRVPLKTILTVWSPPAHLKCVVAAGGNPDWGTCALPLVRPTTTKGGDIIDPAMLPQFADWLNAGLELYAGIGVDVYALSFQNEPMFWQPYNSCFYEQSYYASTLAAVGPRLKAAHPNVKLFGTENMLGIECGGGPNGTAFDPYFYTAAVMRNAAALGTIDVFAVHGYADGVTATPTSKLATLWTSLRTGTASANKPLWMTETSGYVHAWSGAATPGAFDLGQAIYAALAYGRVSAWTYWQGSEGGGLSEYNLMVKLSAGKNYYVSKQFFRYIRPGAQMVALQSADPEVLAVAFEHAAMGAFTVVALNTGAAAKPLVLTGANVPTQFQAIRTSATENAVDLGSVTAGSITLPPSSITTLVNGNVYEANQPPAPDGGPADAGSSDAGVADAGSSDGGTADGGAGPGGVSGACGCQLVTPSAAGGALLALAALWLARARRRPGRPSA